MTQKQRKSGATRRFGDLRHQLRRGGDAHRYYCSLDDDQRIGLLHYLGVAHIQHFGHTKKIRALREISSTEPDFWLVDQFLLSLEPKDGVVAFGQFFASHLNDLWDEAVVVLGDRAEHPSASDIGMMVDDLLDRFPQELIGIFLAAAVEVGLPAKQEVCDFNEFEHRLCPFLAGNVEQANTVEPREIDVDPEVRLKRRERRRQDRQRREEIRLQRDESRRLAKQLDERDCRSQPTASQDSPSDELPLDVEIELERLNHPRLGPSATNLSNDPVGRIGCAYIWWGQQPEQGKARPVLIVGSSASHLWIRPIFTRDFKAGLWRAVVINDWRDAGLDHESFVSPDVIRINRKRCVIGASSLTLLDWNRVCRGEVHK